MTAVDFGRYRRFMQLFWDPEPINDMNAPVWCLGRSYSVEKHAGSKSNSSHNLERDDTSRPSSTIHDADAPPHSASSRHSVISTPQSTSPASSASSALAYTDGHEGEHGGWPLAFLDDFESKFWMTYRSDFEHIPRSPDSQASHVLSLRMRIQSHLMDPQGFSSDTGWGCMIRSGQSLLANTISLLSLGRDWRRGTEADRERRIISQFADDPRAPYSIHSFVRHGSTACGTCPGEWFGPSATARCIQALVNEHERHKLGLRVYSTGDSPEVYEDAFMSMAKEGCGKFHPTLVLVGTRLGIDKVTPVYWEALIAAIQMPQSVGIAGGRPSSSHYFIGAQSTFLFYLDPHHTRPALPYYEDVSQYLTEDLDSCHTRRLRKLHVKEMDPSMLIGFLIRDEKDWKDWRRGVQHVQGKAIITVLDSGNSKGNGPVERESAIDEVETLSDFDDE